MIPDAKRHKKRTPSPFFVQLEPVGVFVNVSRGVANTIAAAHLQGSDIEVFATDDGFRQTMAHEAGHAIGMSDDHPANSIMQEEVGRGAFLGNGSFDEFLAESQDEIDTR